MTPMRGFTMVESMIVLVVTGLLLAIAIPGTTTLLHGSAVRGAALEIETLLSAARQAARARGTMATFEIDTANRQVTIRVGGDTIRTRRIGVVYNVAVHTSRNAVTYGSNGLGYGVSNTTIVLTRGAAAETVTVSRLGRVRR
jgi:prepilin-type N-terminal cleavage/methylation domain-containing protein